MTSHAKGNEKIINKRLIRHMNVDMISHAKGDEKLLNKRLRRQLEVKFSNKRY